MKKENEYAHVYAESRYCMGVSQEYMANALGVSRRTVQNWESGKSCPTVPQTVEWFKTLGINPNPYFLASMYPDVKNLKKDSSDMEIESAFRNIMGNISTESKRALIYLVNGSYNGDPNAMIQLFLAHAHLPIANRYTIANMICEIYKICEATNTLKDTENMLPNIKLLEDAIQKGKDAANKGFDGY